jgi:pimeloyl-[acyl-carrier protein] methyl ester esterase
MNRDVVLINGWGMSAAIWQPLAAALPEGCRLHCIDLHELSSGGAGIGALAAAAARRSPRECDVIAWSLGAQVALQWAVQDAAGPRRLVLIAATPCFVASDTWPSGMASSVFEAFADSLEADAAATLQRFALLQARGDANMGTVARALRAAVCDPSGATPALRSGLDLLRRDDLRPILPRVRQPVCLLHGGNDCLVPVAGVHSLCGSLPDARLHVFGDASHAPHVSQPRRAAEAVMEFLS